jgi:hypothetical protein
MLYTVIFCAWQGYGRTSVTYVWGFPDWVFWGIVVPWITSTVVSLWFAYFVMTDEPLGEEVTDTFDVVEENLLDRMPDSRSPRRPNGAQE